MLTPEKPGLAGPGQREFVLLIASIMMIVAFTIDSMLPALPAIGEALGVDVENRRQLVITFFMLGFGIAQFFVGSLSDQLGRRGILTWSLFAYVILSGLAAAAASFEMLLAARMAQGVAAAGARVLVTSIVRDRFSGRRMAQVMSLASVIFMAAPILAPAMGQVVLAFGSWRWIFWVLALFGAMLWVWVVLRLPESLMVEMRVKLTAHQLKLSFLAVLTDRQSVGYSIAMTCMTGALMGFLISVQQIFANVIGHPEWLPYGFAVMASGMAVASLINARIVMRWGMRMIGHWALIGFTVIGGLHALVAFEGQETIYSFVGLQMLMMMGFSLAAANFGAMAMENVGHVAGTASSLQGSFSTIVGITLGTLIGQAFDGTTFPLYLGYFLLGLVALTSVFVTERGQLFVARNAPVAAGD